MARFITSFPSALELRIASRVGSCLELSVRPGPIQSVPTLKRNETEQLSREKSAVVRYAVTSANAFKGQKNMANNPSKDHRISDKEAVRIAEQTDVSPKQAKDLVKEHGKTKGEEEARNKKDEG